MNLPTDNLGTAFLLTSLTAVLVNFALNNLKTLPGRVKNFLVNRFSVTLEIPEGQYPFEAVKRFLADQPYVFRTRNFSVVYRTDKMGEEIWQLPPAPGIHYFWYKGKLASAFRSRRELTGGEKLAIFENLTVRFFSRAPVIEQFLTEADAAYSSKDGIIGVYAASHWGSWDCPTYNRARKLSTVILPGDTVERIRDGVGEFLDSKEWYQARGIPHRRGFLFHGDPGSGKTSLIKSIAAEFNKSLGVLTLSKLDDKSLTNLFMTVPKDTWPLLEDIDCLFDQREGSDTKVTFSGLLNALDGVASKEGYVLFMTTNHPELLDPALVRPGRIDEQIRLGHATREQAAKYFRHFYGPGHDPLSDLFGDRVGDGLHSMSSIQEHLIRFKHRPAEAVGAFGV